MFERNNPNLQILGERLSVLAEVLGGRAPSSPKAIEVWSDAMKGIPLSYALAVVNRWAAHHTKFPAPAEIRKVAEEDFLRDQERREREKKDNAPRLSEVVPVDPGIAEGMRRFSTALKNHRPVEKLAYVEAVVYHADFVAGKRARDVSPLKWRATLEAFPHAEDPQFAESCRQKLRQERAWKLNLPRPSDYAGGL